MGETEARWLSYRELADLLGITPRAAEARARRNVRAGRWRHRIDNDARKTGRVMVPAADLAAMRQGTPGDAQGDAVGVTRSLAVGDAARATDPHTVAALLAELRQRAERAETNEDALAAEVIKERERRALAEGKAAGLQIAFEQVLGRADRAEARVVDLTGELATERERATAAADAARQAQARALAAEAAREVARGKLMEWTSGGPIARAWRAFVSRRR